MFVWMRSHMRKLMLVVTILTITAFIFLYNTTELDQLSAGNFARIYGKDLTLEQVQREARTYNLALALGLTDYVGTLDGFSSESDPGSFVFNTMIIQHEARALGIVPTDAEIAEAIAALPAFQSSGAFDQTKYQQFNLNFLAPNGLTQVELEEVVRGSLQLERITALLESAPTTSEAEVTYNARLFQPVTGAAVVFQRQKYFDQTKASDADVQTYYEANQFRLMTPELRTARIVTFSLPESDAALTDKARVDALQTVANASAAFADAAVEKPFVEAAKEAGVKVETTLPFDLSGRVVLPAGTEETATDLGGAVVAKIAPTAFSLAESSPVSGSLQDGDSFHVIELASVVPTREKTFDEAKPEIVADLRNVEAETLLESGAKQAVGQIRTELEAGKSLADAVAAVPMAELKPMVDVAPTSEMATPEEREFADDTLQLTDGEMSGVVVRPWGAYAVYLEKRAPLDETKFAENREPMTDFISDRKGGILLYEWLTEAAERSGLRFSGAGEDS